MSDRSSLNWQVLDLINDLIAERGISKTELAREAGMGRNTLFTKLRGETALTTDDIAGICAALGADPELVLKKAWDGRMRDRLAPVTPIGGNVGGSDETVEPTPEALRAAKPRSRNRGEDYGD